jgi:hypothetical protein
MPGMANIAYTGICILFLKLLNANKAVNYLLNNMIKILHY